MSAELISRLNQHLENGMLPDRVDESIRMAIAELSRLKTPYSKPFCWCIESKNSADWCFSADENGVIENAKLLDKDCEQSAPFPLYTHPAKQKATKQQQVGEFDCCKPNYRNGYPVHMPLVVGGIREVCNDPIDKMTLTDDY